MTHVAVRRPGWHALCAAVVLTALAAMLVVAIGGPAAAAPDPHRTTIQQGPSGTNGDTCEVIVCDPGKPNTDGKDGSNKGPTPPGDQVAETVHPKPKPGKDASYLEQLSGESRCGQGPHITAPYNSKRSGQAAGDCLPVKSFGAMFKTTSPTEGIGWQCFVPFFQGGCGRGSTVATGNSAVEEALGTQFGFVWAMYQAVVYLTAWFTHWGVAFEPLSVVSHLAMKLQNTWQHRVIDPLHIGGLGGFVLLLAALWAGLLMLFRRFRRGFAELMVAVVIAAIGAVFLAHPGTTINKLIDGARYFGLTVAAISLDPGGTPTVPTTPASADKVADAKVSEAVSNKLVTSLLLKPHMIANTGQVQHGKCERWYWQALDPDYAHNKASYKKLTDPKNGCVSEGALRPTVERIVLASLLLVMAIVVAAFCLLAVGLLLLSQLAAAAYLAIAGVVWAIAPLAGWGRSMLVKWITGLLVCVAGTVAGVLAIVIYLDVLGVILGLGESPLVSFTLALVVAIVGFMLRKRLTSGLRKGARQIGSKLEGTLSRPGETLAEQAQRQQAGRSPTPAADAVAGGAGAGATAGAVTKMSGTASTPASVLARKDGNHDTDGAAKQVGYSDRVRDGVGQSEQGRRALTTTSSRALGSAPSAATSAASVAGAAGATSAPGAVAVGAAHTTRAAKHTVSKASRGAAEATTASGGRDPGPSGGTVTGAGSGPTGPVPPSAGSTGRTAAGEKATRVASRVSSGENHGAGHHAANGASNHAATRHTRPPTSYEKDELMAELARRRERRDKALSATRPS